MAPPDCSDSSLDTSSYEAFVPERPGGSLRLLLASPEDMLDLGRELALLFQEQEPGGTQAGAVPPANTILLYGPLGAGKTTFARGFVAALPGCEGAEVSSPSFTLCNMYPTRPPVLHCDLYRSTDLQPDGTLRFLPDEVDEAFGADTGLHLVEWAERIPTSAKPLERLDIFFQVCQKGRLALLIPYGAAAHTILDALDRKEIEKQKSSPAAPAPLPQSAFS